MGFLKNLVGSGVVGSLIGGVGSLIGGNQSKKNAEKNALMNYLAQKEFAQNGIRWKVDDAKASGIHPLFALGANTSGYTPVAGYSGDSGLGDFSASMGQSFERAMQAKKTPAEREIERLKQEKMFDLEVQQKEANIALTNAEISRVSRLQQQQVPAMPSASGRTNNVIEGQAQSQPGVDSEIPPIVQFYQMPGGKDVYTLLPHKDSMDYYSEAAIPRYQMFTYITDALRKGDMKGPHDLPKGYYWHVDMLRGIVYPKKRKEPVKAYSPVPNPFGSIDNFIESIFDPSYFSKRYRRR